MTQLINPHLVNLIGIHGPLESGKDTVAQVIVSKFPSLFTQYAFAWPIKQACQIMFGFTEKDMNDRVLKERIHPRWGITPRKAMQLLGTEYGRNMIRKDIWIIRAQIEIDKNLEQGYGTVISDVRFENEAEIIRAKHGLLIHIERPALDTSAEKYNHESEMGIKREPRDIVIMNDAGLTELQFKIDSLFIDDGLAYKEAITACKSIYSTMFGKENETTT